jgi:hypothetical protein
MTFPNLPVATLRVARITQRDTLQRGKYGDSQKNFAPGCRLVTAGDGNMVRADYIGHPRQALYESHEQQGNAGIVVPVQEERPSTCQHAHLRLSRC